MRNYLEHTTVNNFSVFLCLSPLRSTDLSPIDDNQSIVKLHTTVVEDEFQQSSSSRRSGNYLTFPTHRFDCTLSLAKQCCNPGGGKLNSDGCSFFPPGDYMGVIYGRAFSNEKAAMLSVPISKTESIRCGFLPHKTFRC
ncbi:hypothetical protein CEXT_690271 [Caerostris extrusa]|uniref:Uncharacterized protein n=1 Tax=Caerostris extrusa TaxID=172846 RepID=A0AAV4W3N3_CAEEX|nr:hypothetical protein CEXT_690271 [Caerostris extrusa]